MASRILFKDKERKWEEIENKLQAEHDSLLLKSSNKVMGLSMLCLLSAKACDTVVTDDFCNIFSHISSMAGGMAVLVCCLDAESVHLCSRLEYQLLDGLSRNIV